MKPTLTITRPAQKPTRRPRRLRLPKSTPVLDRECFAPRTKVTWDGRNLVCA